MKSLKLLVVTLSIAMLMAVSACATTPPPTPVSTQMLTDGEAELVVATYMVSHVGLPLAKNCLGDVGDPITHETSYHENGKWKVQVNSCLFIVDDSTGKVTGP